MKLQVFIVALILFNALPVVAQSAATGSDNISTVETAQFKADSKLGCARERLRVTTKRLLRNSFGALTRERGKFPQQPLKT